MERVSFLGPKTSFTHEAALIAFPRKELIEKKTINEVFESVKNNETTYGVVPIENSSGGSVPFTLDELMSGVFFINKEFFLEIKQNLIGNCKIKNIEKIYSHPQGFIQCQNWLKNNLKEIEQIETTSTAKAAEIIAKEKNSAAICSILAAKEFNLKIIKNNINDDTENTTKFVVISKNKNNKSENKKSSIIFGVKNEPGSLFNTIEAFKKFKINMTKIESRPSKKKKWEYLFFIDFEGNLEENNVKNALKEIEKHSTEIILLGSY